MRVLIVGVSCVGKTTIGGLLAGRLGHPFFDLDKETESHFGTSIERLQSRFLTDYSYRKEASVVLKRIVATNRDCVVALPPSGLRDAYLRVIRKVECVTVTIKDTPRNIVERIRFYDIDSRPIPKHLTDEEKRLYQKEIKKDITHFKKSHQRADIHVDITGLDAAAGAARIEELLPHAPKETEDGAARAKGKPRPSH